MVAHQASGGPRDPPPVFTTSPLTESHRKVAFVYSGVVTARSGDRPPFDDAPLGTCKWCGEAILYPEWHVRGGEINLRRNWHSADAGHARDCLEEYKRTNWPSYRRKQVLKRDDYRCTDCLAEGLAYDRDVRKDVDHILALVEGGTNDFSNLVTRCRYHHRLKTAQEARERAARRRGPD